MMAYRPNPLELLTDFNLTQIIQSLLAFARSAEEKEALLGALGTLGELGVRALEALATAHSEIAKAVMPSYLQAREEYRQAAKLRSLFGFARREELLHDSHRQALRDARELLFEFSLPAQPEAGQIISENRATIAALRDALLWQLDSSRDHDVQGGLVRRLFNRILEQDE